jgi:hypothetical protein
MGLIIFVGNQEPPGLPQEAHVTDQIPSTKRVIKIGNKHLSPQAPSLVESYPAITLVLVHLAANDVFIINNDQNITFLGYIIFLIIVWAL